MSYQFAFKTWAYQMLFFRAVRVFRGLKKEAFPEL